MKEFGYQEVVEATEGFSAERVIGKGSHGWVYRATLRINGHDHPRDVAIKKSSIRDHTKLLNEATVMSSLHLNPHVVNVIGTSQSDTAKLLVMDLMPNGSLYDLLHSATATAPPLPWAKRLHLALQIAKAVRSLHAGEPPIIHRDIKSANILFDSEWNIKLADFGLAILKGGEGGRTNYNYSPPAGTIGYMDPCYTTPDGVSTKNDVFSFGVVLLEILSSGKAIDVSRTPSDIAEWAREKRRWREVCDARVPMPSHMEDTVMAMLRIALSCVSESEFRPMMEQVVERMEVKPARFPVIMAERRRWWWAFRWSSGGGEEKRSMVTLREVLASG